MLLLLPMWRHTYRFTILKETQTQRKKIIHFYRRIDVNAVVFSANEIKFVARVGSEHKPFSARCWMSIRCNRQRLYSTIVLFLQSNRYDWLLYKTAIGSRYQFVLCSLQLAIWMQNAAFATGRNASINSFHRKQDKSGEQSAEIEINK